MQIPPEAWPIIGSIFLAIGYWLKRDADAKLTQAKTEADKSRSLFNMIEGQQKNINALYHTNAQFAQFLREKERIDERNYKVNRQIFDSNTQMLLTHVSQRTQIILDAINNVPKRLEAFMADSTREIAFTVGSEIGAAMNREFALQNLDRKLHPFPDAEDPRWTKRKIVPTVRDVIIRKEPYFQDESTKLTKSCSRIADTGDWVLLIEEPSIGAVAVEKVDSGVRCWGWLPKHAVQIIEPVD